MLIAYLVKNLFVIIGLTGPALSIQTACSTSLVAVPLRKDVPSPLAPKNDAEGADHPDGAPAPAGAGPPGAAHRATGRRASTGCEGAPGEWG